MYEGTAKKFRSFLMTASIGFQNNQALADLCALVNENCCAARRRAWSTSPWRAIARQAVVHGPGSGASNASHLPACD